MTLFLEVETADFADAARTMCLQVAEPIGQAVTGLSTDLAGSGGMAGSDAGGRDWAASYDTAAHTALQAGIDATNGCYTLASMFARSARNYADAEAASTAGGRGAATLVAARVPYDGRLLMTAALPSVAGGSGGEPFGWSIVQTAVGFAWPNGHQDRLHEAAAAWQRSARVLDDRAFTTVMAGISFPCDRLPEAGDITTACGAVRQHLIDLAKVYRTLGSACTGLAHHLDVVHSQVISELESLGIESGAIQAVGAIASVVSFGTAEAPTQAAQAARIAAVVKKIKGLIEAFLTAVRGLTVRVARAVERADRVAAELAGLRDVRLTTAVVTSVRSLPVIKQAGELGALARLQLTVRRDWPRLSGILRDAARGKGDFGLGAVTREQSEALGRAWVGPGAHLSSDGKAWVSRDGLRQYRPVYWKKGRRTYQANLETRVRPRGEWQHNGHLDIKKGP